MKNESEYIKKSVEINAADDRVWEVLTGKEHTTKWANAFYEGTYVESDWTEGSPVVWKMPGGEIAASGKVEVNYIPRLLKLTYPGENKDDNGTELGVYHENYSLLEQDGKTMLTIESGPLKDSDIDQHSPMWDKALSTIKQLAETD